MCKSRLLLDDVPVFHENLFKIRCSRVISGNKWSNFFRLLCFVTKNHLGTEFVFSLHAARMNCHARTRISFGLKTGMNSFRNDLYGDEISSGIKVIPVSCKQSLNHYVSQTVNKTHQKVNAKLWSILFNSLCNE